MQIKKWNSKRYFAFLAALCILCSTTAIMAGAAGERTIENEEQLKNAFFDGGQYRLTNNVHLQQTLHLSNTAEDGIFGLGDLALNLNGYFISCETTVLEIGAYGENEKGSIQITDSKGTGGMRCIGPAGAAIKLLSTEPYTHTLTIDAGTYQAQQSALWIGDKLPSSRVQINRGIFYCSGSSKPVDGNYTASAPAILSPDQRTLTVGDTPPESTTLPDPPASTQAPTLPSSSPSEQNRTAVLNANAAIPQASYILHIPASITVPRLERCAADAPDKITLTPFEITITDTANFFDEKAVELRLQSDFLLTAQADKSYVLPYSIRKDGSDYAGDIPFAALDESHPQTQAEIAIDRSLIRHSGLYDGYIEFEIALRAS